MKHFVLFIILVFTFSSCADEIELDNTWFANPDSYLLNVRPNELSFKCNGGTDYFHVDVDAFGQAYASYSVSKSGDWFTVSTIGPTIVISANKNITSVELKGTITVTFELRKGSNITRTFHIKQEAWQISGKELHEAIDLGLSVKWATCNIGANSPEDLGYYFAWGEVYSKSFFDGQTYKWYDVETLKYKKYCLYPKDGVVDGMRTLVPDDDAAFINWGGGWRIPTTEEFEELLHNCTWEWTNKGTKVGYIVSSNKNGNSIFLPAAGEKYEDHNSNVGWTGLYWSNSISESFLSGPYYLFFNTKDKSISSTTSRDSGFPIRPVCP